jgi:hypothetical protein
VIVGAAATRFVLRGVLVGGLGAALVVLAWSAGLLQGWLGLVLLAVALLAIPTSRELARRVLVTGCIVLGWLPVAWWFPWPSSGVGHATVLLAGGVGVLLGWTVGGPDLRRRATRLVPRVRLADAVPLLATLGAVVVVLPWLTVPDADGALSLLLRGWDHSAHYDIVHMLREHGSVLGVLGPAPLGDTWSYGAYPQGFHAVAATLMEVQAGAAPLGRPEEVLLYARTLGLITVLSATVLAAGVCAVPFLRRNPWLALPAAVLAVGGLLLGPAGFTLSDGFPNFALATVLLACIPLLVLPLDRVFSPVHLAAVGGAIVGVAHGWVLLLSVALPAAAVLLVPLRRQRYAADATARWLSGAIVALTAAASGAALLMVARQPVAEVLTVPGAITAPPVEFLVAPAVLAIAACLVTAWLPRWSGERRRADRRVVATAVVPLVGLAGAGAIAALQIRAGAPLGYYFWKYSIGVAALSIVLVAVVAARLVPPGIRRRPAAVRVASVVLAIGATQVFGATVLRADTWWASPAVQVRARLAEVVASPAPLAPMLWDAAEADLAPGLRHVLLLPGDVTGVHPATAGQWYNAVTARWTNEANEELRRLFAATATVAERADVAADVLTADTDSVVIVLPSERAAVAELLPEGLRGRVVSW